MNKSDDGYTYVEILVSILISLIVFIPSAKGFSLSSDFKEYQKLKEVSEEVYDLLSSYRLALVTGTYGNETTVVFLNTTPNEASIAFSNATLKEKGFTTRNYPGYTFNYAQSGGSSNLGGRIDFQPKGNIRINGTLKIYSPGGNYVRSLVLPPNSSFYLCKIEKQ